MSRERFIEIVTNDLPDAPAYFTYDAVLNTRERPTLEQALARELRPLALSRVLELAENGAQMLDTRESAKFEGAHLKGSVNVGLNGSYATWCGTLLDPDRPIVVIAEPGREVESAMRLGRIAFDSVDGYLDGGMQTLAGRPGLVARIERITATTLAERLVGAEPPLLIDVRSPWRMAGRANRGCGQRPALALAGAHEHAAPGRVDRRSLRDGLPLGDRRQPSAA